MHGQLLCYILYTQLASHMQPFLIFDGLPTDFDIKLNDDQAHCAYMAPMWLSLRRGHMIGLLMYFVLIKKLNYIFILYVYIICWTFNLRVNFIFGHSIMGDFSLLVIYKKSYHIWFTLIEKCSNCGPPLRLKLELF